ncbi:MAG: DUF2000 domain-containing protein [Actinomycetota bacterium]
MSDVKIAVAVRNDLAVWQRLNVTAFLASGLGAVDPELIGAPYVDGDGRQYPPMLASPVRVFAGDLAALRRSADRAKDRGLLVTVYVDEMFATMNDADNRAAFGKADTTEMMVAGLVVVGEPKQVDKAFDKLKPHD